jgi:hypothetical protein
MERIRTILCTLIGITAVVLAVGAALATEDTTGKISLVSTSVGAGLGFAWGDGVLEYRGHRYPFKVTGFSIVDVGVAKVFAKGEVYNLKTVEDFEGMFMAAVASGTFAGGAGAAAMQNQNDVKMVWTATNQGLSFSLAQAGINVKFTEEARQAARSHTIPSDVQPAAAPGTSR